MPAVGTCRRVRALVTAGWSMAEQARRCGVSQSTISELAWDRREWISAQMADTVAGVYAELQHVPGGSTGARNLGRRQGWPPPAAWDPDKVDDPMIGPGDRACRRCPYCGGPLNPEPP